MSTEETNLPKLFLNKLEQRVMVKNYNANIMVEGTETGVGKSYIAMKLCEDIHNAHSDILDPFTIDNIFFNPEEVLEFVTRAKKYSCGIYDDAGATAGNRNWFDEVIRILGKAAQTFRFRNLILFITVPFGIEVDVDLRRLSHYKIVVLDRGFAKVYRTKFKTFANKGRGAIYSYHIFDLGNKKDVELRIPLPSKKLYTEYEKKKAEVFENMYKTDIETIKARNKQQEWFRLKSRSDDAIMKEIISNIDKYRSKDVGDLDTNLIRYHSNVGFNRAQYLKNILREIHGIE